MVIPTSRSAVSQIGVGTIVLAAVAAWIGASAVKKDDAAAEENKPLVDRPADLRPVGESPHRDFIADYFRGRSGQPKSNEVAEKKPGPTQWQAEVSGATLKVADKTPPAETRPDPTLVLKEHADDVDILIATVPDPVDTPLGSWYDQIIESFTLAAGQASYTFTGHWSPWEDFRLSQAKKDEAKAGPVTPLFERFPGVLLFRRQIERRPEKVLVILLVGETPNAVNSSALFEALNLVGDMQACRPGQPIRMIAPIFTGAQAPLLQEIQQWKKLHPLLGKFEIVSGSGSQLTRPDDRDIDWQSCVIPSNLLRNAALRFLRDRSIDSTATLVDAPRDFERVALLTESNSGYGVFVDSKSVSVLEREGLLNFKYPMHLSRLQTQDTKEKKELDKRLGLARGQVSLATGPVPVRPNAELVLSLDEATTMAVVSGRIDEIMRTIRRNRIKTVGIISTDPLDKVFLVRRLKARCPDVEIFITGMDATFCLPEHQYDMRGVFFATPYPLYGPNQGWTRPDSTPRQPFASFQGQGCYNAMVFQLGKITDRTDDWIASSLFEYASPASAWSDNANDLNRRRPPIWIVSMAEHGHLVPHGFYENYKLWSKQDRPFADDSQFKDVDQRLAPVITAGQPVKPVVTWPWLTSFRALAAIVLTVGGGLLFWIARDKGLWNIPKIKYGSFREFWFSALSAEEQQTSVLQQLILAAMTLVAVPFVLVLTEILVSPGLRESSDADRWCLLVLNIGFSVIVLIVSLLTLRMSVRFLRSMKRSDWLWWPRLEALVLQRAFGVAPKRCADILKVTKDANWAWWARLGVHVLILGVTWWFCGKLAFGFALHADRPTALLAVQRAIEIPTGHSVLPPLVLMAAGFLLYAHFGLKRQYAAQRFAINPPYPDSGPGRLSARRPYSGIQEWATKLRARLGGLFDFAGQRPWPFAFVVAVVVVMMAFLLTKNRAMLEYRAWHYLFAFGLTALAGLVFTTLVRFLDGWKEIEGMLSMIALVPMVRAFDRLPRKAASLFGGYLTTRSPRSADLVIPIHILRQLRDLPELHAVLTPSPMIGVGAKMVAPVTVGSPEARTTNGSSVGVVNGAVIEAGVLTSAAVVSAPASRPSDWSSIPEPIARRLENGINWQEYDREAGLGVTPYEDADFECKTFNELSGHSRALLGALAPHWSEHTVDDAFGRANAEAADSDDHARGDSSKKSGEGDNDMPRWVRLAEDFVAIQAIIFISQYFMQLRYLAWSMVAGSLLLMLAVTSYPFQPERWLTYSMLGLLALVSIALVTVMVSLNKNEIYSRITRSTPNRFELNVDFVMRLVTFVGPIVLIAGAQLSGGLRALFLPILEQLR